MKAKYRKYKTENWRGGSWDIGGEDGRILEDIGGEDGRILEERMVGY
jgi:hypothetical protein